MLSKVRSIFNVGTLPPTCLPFSIHDLKSSFPFACLFSCKNGCCENGLLETQYREKNISGKRDLVHSETQQGQPDENKGAKLHQHITWWINCSSRFHMSPLCCVETCRKCLLLSMPRKNCSKVDQCVLKLAPNAKDGTSAALYYRSTQLKTVTEADK